MKMWSLTAAFFQFLWTWLGQWYLLRSLLGGPNFQGLSRADKARVRQYAQLVPSIAITAYRVLATWRLSRDERTAITLLSAATPLIDDYFDDPARSPLRLQSLIASPEACIPEDEKESYLLELLRFLHVKTQDSTHFHALADRVVMAQMASKSQTDVLTTWEDLRQIALEKGGASTLLFHALLQRPPVEGAEIAMYHLGGMMQFLDDIFDVYEDSRAGIRTTVTAAARLTTLRGAYRADREALAGHFRALPLPAYRIERFLHLLPALWALGDVALDQWERASTPETDVFDPNNRSRKELVCDMARIRNQLRWIRRLFEES